MWIWNNPSWYAHLGLLLTLASQKAEAPNTLLYYLYVQWNLDTAFPHLVNIFSDPCWSPSQTLYSVICLGIDKSKAWNMNDWLLQISMWHIIVCKHWDFILEWESLQTQQRSWQETNSSHVSFNIYSMIHVKATTSFTYHWTMKQHTGHTLLDAVHLLPSLDSPWIAIHHLVLCLNNTLFLSIPKWTTLCYLPMFS
jgi:hypothetical protein